MSLFTIFSCITNHIWYRLWFLHCIIVHHPNRFTFVDNSVRWPRIYQVSVHSDGGTVAALLLPQFQMSWCPARKSYARNALPLASPEVASRTLRVLIELADLCGIASISRVSCCCFVAFLHLFSSLGCSSNATFRRSSLLWTCLLQPSHPLHHQ